MTKEQLQAILSTYLDEEAEELALDDDLTEAGLDSIAFMSITAELRAKNSMVTFMDLAEEPTMEAWLRKFNEKVAAQ